jgi:hypothetical protein
MGLRRRGLVWTRAVTRAAVTRAVTRAAVTRTVTRAAVTRAVTRAVTWLDACSPQAMVGVAQSCTVHTPRDGKREGCFCVKP